MGILLFHKFSFHARPFITVAVDECVVNFAVTFLFSVDKIAKMCYNKERGVVIFRKNDLPCISRATMLTFLSYSVNKYSV